MTDAIAAMIPMLAATLLHFLWQGTLVGVLAWLLLSLLHAARPQARYAVACGALLACVLPRSAPSMSRVLLVLSVLRVCSSRYGSYRVAPRPTS